MLLYKKCLNKIKNPINKYGDYFTGQDGLEPSTSKLTVFCTANCATGHLVNSNFFVCLQSYYTPSLENRKGLFEKSTRNLFSLFNVSI